MIKGFTLEIENQTELEFTIPLFQEFDLPNGIKIKVKGSDYHYGSLFQMAKNQGFIGDSLLSNFETTCIINNNKIIQLTPGKVYDELTINIDGYTRYISITIPPHTHGVLQLHQKM